MKKVALHLKILLMFLLLFFVSSARSQVLIRDAETEQYIKSIANPIFTTANLSLNQTNIYLIAENQINAFVANGQNLYLYTGLILRMDNEDELRGVISHETGHMVGGHLSRLKNQIDFATYQAMIGMALGAAAMALGKNDGMGELGTAMMVGSQDIAMKNLLSYSRGEEEMADETGVNLLSKSKKNSEGLLSFMEKLKYEQMFSPQISPYLQSHPVIDDRISHLKASIKKHKNYNKSNNENFLRIKSKLQGYLLSEYDYNLLKKDTFNYKYGKVLNLMKYNKIDEAIALCNDLLKIKKDDPYVLELLGEIYYSDGKFEKSDKYFNIAYQKTNSPLILTDLAKTQIDLKQYDSAISNLKVAIFKDTNAYAYKLLSIAYGKKSLIPESNYYLAEYYFKIGDKKNCEKALNKAIKTLNKESSEYLKASDLKLELKAKKE